MRPSEAAAPEESSSVALRRQRVVGLGVLGFLLMLSYALARPPAEALFLQAHGKEALPYVWLNVAVFSALSVWIYNRLVTRMGLLVLFALVSAISAGLFALTIASVAAELPGARYALYIWKDIYIVALVEIFYSYANSVFPIRTARWAYGFFGVVGAVGGTLGHLAVGRIAHAWGSPAAIWILVPLLLVLALFALAFGRRAGLGAPLSRAGVTGSFLEALTIVRQSSYLSYVLAMIATVQTVVTLIDFDFNALVAASFASVEAKTAAIGDVYAAMSIATFVLHGATGPTLKLCGVPATLLAIPVLLASSIAGFCLWPIFIVGAMMKVGSKSFDYTLFRASKEILYIPLSYRERTQGKALVDMLTYRVAKGGASLVVLALVRLQATSLARMMSLALTVLWLTLTLVVTRRFRRHVSREDELRRREEG